jgi:excisionase family DNA binding protein
VIPQAFDSANPAPLAQQWLTASEAAAYLRVDSRTLLRWAREGKVLGFQLSGTTRHVWRFRHVDLDATLTGPAVPQPKGEMIQ